MKQYPSELNRLLADCFLEAMGGIAGQPDGMPPSEEGAGNEAESLLACFHIPLDPYLVQSYGPDYAPARAGRA